MYEISSKRMIRFFLIFPPVAAVFYFFGEAILESVNEATSLELARADLATLLFVVFAAIFIIPEQRKKSEASNTDGE